LTQFSLWCLRLCPGPRFYGDEGKRKTASYRLEQIRCTSCSLQAFSYERTDSSDRNPEGQGMVLLGKRLRRMVEVVTIILVGGRGTRLYPLTKNRIKPAVPIEGKFRFIDISISNCIHSGLRKIFILTQFSSESLHRHIFKTFLFDNFSKDFVTILSAQQTVENLDWYQGTEDAVRQNGVDYFSSVG
jgi:hypothetical protein